MSGEAIKVQSMFLPPPTGGLNYVDNPAALPPTEARTLQNYLVFPWGIMQRSKEESHLNSSFANCYIYPYWDNGIEKMLIFKTDTYYRLDSEVDTTPTTLSGYSTPTGRIPQVCYFNKRIFFFNARQKPLEFTISAGTAANSAFTGPPGNGTNLGYGWTFKSRMYAFEKTDYDASAVPTKVWYTDIDAISGAMTSVDFASIFTLNCSLVAGFSWSVNQGIQSEELFCLLGDTGEMLIYSGDSPEAPNWQLIARIQIPLPLDNEKILKVGQETYINTTRGLIPMSQIFSARVGAGIEQASLSRKLGELNLGKSAITRWSPFAFLTGNSGVYALNYETGSWSYLKFSSAVTDVGCCGANLFFSNSSGLNKMVLPRGSHYLNGNAENAGTEATRAVWKTPFFELGTTAKKKLSRVKAIGADVSLSTTFKNSAYCVADYEDDSTSTTPPSTGLDSQQTTTIDNSTSYMLKRLYQQELRPTGSGNRISICFNKIPSSEINEIHGIEVMFESGGMY